MDEWESHAVKEGSLQALRRRALRQGLGRAEGLQVTELLGFRVLGVQLFRVYGFGGSVVSGLWFWGFSCFGLRG